MLFFWGNSTRERYLTTLGEGLLKSMMNQRCLPRIRNGLGKKEGLETPFSDMQERSPVARSSTK